MRAKSNSPSTPGSRAVKDIRRATRQHFSAEDKIQIVLDGLRGEDSIAGLCRKEDIAQSLFAWRNFTRCCGRAHPTMAAA